MKARATLVALTLALTPGVVRAEIDPPEDALSAAYYAAERELQAGKDRGEITERLKPVVAKHPKSAYYNLAAAFLTDLTDSIGDPPGRDATPDERLADTRIRLWDIRASENWPGGEKPFLKADPNDPAYQLLIRDRNVIDKLIPLLKSRAPTRSDNPRFVSGSGLNPQPRVCDVALAIIEYHGCCRFHQDTIHGSLPHQYPAVDHDKLVRRVGDWWAENKDKPVAAGVRAQLPHARTYPEQVWMAKALVRVSEGLKTDDKEHGLKVLRDLVKQKRWLDVSSKAAVALGEVGDAFLLEFLHDELKTGRGGRYDRGSMARVLILYGKRREWELLTTLAAEEIRAGVGPDEAAVWSQVLWTEPSDTNPYAIPIIGLSLSFEYRDSKYAYSMPLRALTALHRQLGKEFGYKRGGTEAEYHAAVAKARAWWDAEGKATYTFDYIEKNLAPNAVGK